MSVNMWITDDQGLHVKGGSQIKGRENSVEVAQIYHSIYIPFDHDTSVIQGTRKHAPLDILKKIDEASPFLAKSCCSGKTLQQIRIDLYRVNDHGQETLFFRYTLNDAKVISISPIITSNGFSLPYLERISIAYKKISWLYLEGNYSHSDSWDKR